MKFKRIQVQNFASYYNKSPRIDLGTSSKKPVVIFIGGTGFGKTSLFDAINWALYGEEYEKDLLSDKGKDREILDYVNETALNEASITGETVTMSVQLDFEHDNKNYYITQTLVVKPQKNGDKLKALERDRITQLKQILPSGDHETIGYDRIFLDRILPNNVKSYFLFDGDRIHNLAKPGNSKEVQDAIYRVVDLEIVRNTAEHLEEVAERFSKDAAKAAKGKLAEIEAKYIEEQEEEKRIKKRIRNIKSEQKAIKSQLIRLAEKLRDRDETTKLQGQRDHLNSEIKRITEERKRLKVELRDAAAKASLGIANKQINELKDLLEKKRKKGEIPKHVQETFFEDLYELEECICGTHFDAKKGDPIYDKLKERAKIEGKRSKEDDALLTLSFDLKEAVKEISNSKLDLDKIENKIMELDKQSNSLVMEKQEVDNALKELPVEDINKLIRERETREETQSELDRELGSQNEILKNVQDRLKDLEQKRKEAGKKQKEARGLQFRSELARKAGITIETLYEQFAEECRSEVEKLTIEEFKKFVISSSGYHVELNKDYELEVLDSNGNRALQRLSMGQSQCLSLAFITAISRVSEKNPPLVIDMPFSRLDPSTHEAISKQLPKISEQTILFLIPETEWNDKTEPNLRSYANYIYNMDFDEKQRQTTIENIT